MNDEPSSLAVRLATRFAPKEANAAKQIDEIIRWHGWDERQRIRDGNKLIPSFCDNINVFRSRERGEFFELQLLPPESDAPYWVQFKRYAVPGRYWVYAFQWHPSEGAGCGPRVVYGSEGTENLSKSLKLIEADLNKPQVIELFEEAFGAERIVCRYQHDTLALIKAVAPKSKTYRVIRKLCEKTMEARQARIHAQSEEA